MDREPFATTADGQSVERFTLTNTRGMVVRVITWGATLTEVHVPDRAGDITDVVLGFDDPGRWLEPHPFFGCIAGRFANRIAHGRFQLEGQWIQLPTNDGEHHLHGGTQGFDKRLWQVDRFDTASIRLRYTSPAGEQGYPGALTVRVTYSLQQDNSLAIAYEAETDSPTVLNVTNHAYFNLGRENDILSHTLEIPSARYTEVDGASIPTGNLIAVPPVMDFRKPKPIGEDLDQLRDAPGGGYDHNFCVEGWDGQTLRTAAILRERITGRKLTVSTTEPGIQFYSGNYLKSVRGKGGRTYEKHSGLCLETQHFPDSPNYPHFPTTVLRPGEIYRSKTVFGFAVE